MRGISDLDTLSAHITVLAFGTHEDMAAAHRALARATNITRVSHLNGAEQLATRDGREIWFGVAGFTETPQDESPLT